MGNTQTAAVASQNDPYVNTTVNNPRKLYLPKQNLVRRIMNEELQIIPDRNDYRQFLSSFSPRSSVSSSSSSSTSAPSSSVVSSHAARYLHHTKNQWQRLNRLPSSLLTELEKSVDNRRVLGRIKWLWDIGEDLQVYNEYGQATLFQGSDSSTNTTTTTLYGKTVIPSSIANSIQFNDALVRKSMDLLILLGASGLGKGKPPVLHMLFVRYGGCEALVYVLAQLHTYIMYWSYHEYGNTSLLSPREYRTVTESQRHQTFLSCVFDTACNLLACVQEVCYAVRLTKAAEPPSIFCTDLGIATVLSFCDFPSTTNVALMCGEEIFSRVKRTVTISGLKQAGYDIIRALLRLGPADISLASRILSLLSFDPMLQEPPTPLNARNMIRRATETASHVAEKYLYHEETESSSSSVIDKVISFYDVRSTLPSYTGIDSNPNIPSSYPSELKELSLLTHPLTDINLLQYLRFQRHLISASLEVDSNVAAIIAAGNGALIHRLLLIAVAPPPPHEFKQQGELLGRFQGHGRRMIAPGHISAGIDRESGGLQLFGNGGGGGGGGQGNAPGGGLLGQILNAALANPANTNTNPPPPPPPPPPPTNPPPPNPNDIESEDDYEGDGGDSDDDVAQYLDMIDAMNDGDDEAGENLSNILENLLDNDNDDDNHQPSNTASSTSNPASNANRNVANDPNNTTANPPPPPGPATRTSNNQVTMGSLIMTLSAGTLLQADADRISGMNGSYIYQDRLHTAVSTTNILHRHIWINNPSSSSSVPSSRADKVRTGNMNPTVVFSNGGSVVYDKINGSSESKLDSLSDLPRFSSVDFSTNTALDNSHANSSSFAYGSDTYDRSSLFPFLDGSEIDLPLLFSTYAQDWDRLRQAVTALPADLAKTTTAPSNPSSIYDDAAHVLTASQMGFPLETILEMTNTARNGTSATTNNNTSPTASNRLLDRPSPAPLDHYIVRRGIYDELGIDIIGSIRQGTRTLSEEEILQDKMDSLGIRDEGLPTDVSADVTVTTTTPSSTTKPKLTNTKDIFSDDDVVIPPSSSSVNRNSAYPRPRNVTTTDNRVRSHVQFSTPEQQAQAAARETAAEQGYRYHSSAFGGAPNTSNPTAHDIHNNRTNNNNNDFSIQHNRYLINLQTISPHKAEAAFVVSALMSGPRRRQIQDFVAALGGLPPMAARMAASDWLFHPGGAPPPRIHGPNCECRPETGDTVHLLRLLMGLVDRECYSPLYRWLPRRRFMMIPEIQRAFDTYGSNKVHDLLLSPRRKEAIQLQTKIYGHFPSVSVKETYTSVPNPSSDGINESSLLLDTVRISSCRPWGWIKPHLVPLESYTDSPKYPPAPLAAVNTIEYLSINTVPAILDAAHQVIWNGLLTSSSSSDSVAASVKQSTNVTNILEVYDPILYGRNALGSKPFDLNSIDSDSEESDEEWINIAVHDETLSVGIDGRKIQPTKVTFASRKHYRRTSSVTTNASVRKPKEDLMIDSMCIQTGRREDMANALAKRIQNGEVGLYGPELAPYAARGTFSLLFTALAIAKPRSPYFGWLSSVADGFVRGSPLPIRLWSMGHGLIPHLVNSIENEYCEPAICAAQGIPSVTKTKKAKEKENYSSTDHHHSHEASDGDGDSDENEGGGGGTPYIAVHNLEDEEADRSHYWGQGQSAPEPEEELRYGLQGMFDTLSETIRRNRIGLEQIAYVDALWSNKFLPILQAKRFGITTEATKQHDDDTLHLFQDFVPSQIPVENTSASSSSLSSAVSLRNPSVPIDMYVAFASPSKDVCARTACNRSIAGSPLMRLACDRLADAAVFLRGLATTEDWAYGIVATEVTVEVPNPLDNFQETSLPVIHDGKVMDHSYHSWSWEGLTVKSALLLGGYGGDSSNTNNNYYYKNGGKFITLPSSFRIPWYGLIDTTIITSPLVQFFTMFRIPLIHGLISCVRYDTIAQDTLCAITTALQQFVIAHRHGALPALVDELRKYDQQMRHWIADTVNNTPPLLRPSLNDDLEVPYNISSSPDRSIASPRLTSSAPFRLDSLSTADETDPKTILPPLIFSPSSPSTKATSSSNDATSASIESSPILAGFAKCLIVWLELHSLRDRERRASFGWSGYTYPEWRTIARALLGLPVDTPISPPSVVDLDEGYGNEQLNQPAITSSSVDYTAERSHHRRKLSSSTSPPNPVVEVEGVPVVDRLFTEWIKIPKYFYPTEGSMSNQSRTEVSPEQVYWKACCLLPC